MIQIRGDPNSQAFHTPLILLQTCFYPQSSLPIFFFPGILFSSLSDLTPPNAGHSFPLPRKAQGKTEKRMRGSKRSTGTSAHTFDRESVILVTVGSSALPLKGQRE